MPPADPINPAAVAAAISCAPGTSGPTPAVRIIGTALAAACAVVFIALAFTIR